MKETDNVILSLRISPNASRNEITGFTDDILAVRISAPPVSGKANRELVSFLSKKLGVSKSSVVIIKGLTSRNKAVSVSGLSTAEIISRLSV